MFGLSQNGASDQNASNNNGRLQRTFAQLRIMKDFNELESLPSTCEVTQNDPSDLFHFTVTISPDDGFYKGGRFIFSITIPSDYPNVAPKIQCTQTIYHPNINLNGNVCLNILRDDWKPMLTLVTVVLGLIFLFLEPNPDDPLNQEAAAVLTSDVNLFKSNVNKTMSGGMLNSVQYNNMKKSKIDPIIVETSVGKFLVRDFRPPIQLRTSPRKKKNKLKKDIKRLNENSSLLFKNKKQQKRKIKKIKKQIHFQDNDKQQEKNSILFIISNDQQDNQLNEQELTNYKCNLCFVDSTTHRALIFSPQSSRLTFLGIYSLIQISGPSAFLHGFTLQPLKRYSIFNISSQSLMSIETSSSSSKSSFNENQILSFFNDYHIQLPLPEIYIDFIKKLAKFHHGLSVFYIEQLETTWIESIKQFNNNYLSNQWLFNNKNNNDQEEQQQNTDGFKQLWTGMGAFKDSYYRSIVYSPEIRSITDEIISRLSTKTPNDRLIIFVCGAKDSGKSTYLRYLINECLSQTNSISKLTFLDCDIGQSEFTPSGSISLINNLTEPLFGPSSSHLKKPLKSFYFGNIKVENDQIIKYLNYIKLSYDYIQNEQYDLLLVNTMGWGSDLGLVIIKELIDMIKPNIVIQLRSSNPHFRHIMPDITPQWSLNAPISNIYRQTNKIPLNVYYNEYDYYLLLTPIRQHSQEKSSLTRQSCLWSYFSQIEKNQLIIKPLIDYKNSIQILQFDKIGVGLLHRQIEPKYILQVLNGSIVTLCRVKHDMLYQTSNLFPSLIDERANVECLGFGFIRSIDMTRREIHVIIPDNNLPKTMINALIKGQDDCPDEFYFMSIDRWRGYMPPYVTGVFNSTM